MNQIIIDGQAAYQAERQSRDVSVKPSAYRPGCLDTETLIKWQTSPSNTWKSVQLVNTKYGWSVRATSGIDNFALLAGKRCGNVDGSYEDAARWASAWVAQDPRNRYAYTTAFELGQPE